LSENLRRMKKLVASLLLTLPLLAATNKPAPPPDLTTPPADAERGEDGLVTRRLAAGTGTESPRAGDILKLRYTVWRSDTGAVLDHVDAPRVAMLPLERMLPGWRAASMKMVAGERRRIWIPENLGAGKVPPGVLYVVDSELVEIIRPPATPADVAAPPADAITTKSGLAYKVLRPGTGTVRPTRRSTVVVHYTGWTTDGKMFDSSVLRGEPSTFPIDGVIRGWTEGLQLMTEGELTRFWIPSKLAYGKERGKPQGMLVFDIELVDVK
jgi:FKBP-type peptidyl-prolyl cis-trans isomerase